jgi:hypothetical protein
VPHCGHGALTGVALVSSADSEGSAGPPIRAPHWSQ